MESIEMEVISKSPQTPKLRQNIRIVGIICTVYLAGLLGGLCVLLLVPSAPASSGTYKTLYFTDNFEPFKFFYYTVLVVSGVVYTKSVTLKNYLRTTNSSSETSADTVLFMFISLLIFLLGPNATLKADTEGSYVGLILYNYVCYTMPYVGSLHVTYIISGVVFKISLNADAIWKSSYRSWIPLSIFCTVCVGLIGYQLYLLYLYDRIIVYVAVYGAALAIGYTVYYFNKRRHRINDYFWAWVLVIPLTATPSIGSAILQSICLGVYIEGVVRVGFKNIILT